MSPADQHVNLGLPVSRRHPLRKLVARVLWPFLRHQIDYNREALSTALDHERRLEALESELAPMHRALQHHGETIERHEGPLAEVVAHVRNLLAAVGVHDETFRRHDEVLERLDEDEKEGRLIARELVEVLEERIELVQRQAFARYHEGNGALRRDLVDLTQDFTEFVDRLEGDLATRDDDARAARHAFGEHLQRIRDDAGRHDSMLERSLAEQRMWLSEIDLVLATLRRSADGQKAAELVSVPGNYREVREALKEAIAEPSALLRERLFSYLEDLAGAAKLGAVLDLTVRNGEWLEVLGEAGISAYGVVTNDARAEVARSKGLDVRQDEPLAHLRDVAPGTLGAITAFGLLEDLDIDEILELLALGTRALRSGGVLLLECLNPANLIVATSEFYADPGRRRPLPAATLSFLVGSRGFMDVTTRFGTDRTAQELRLSSPENAPWAADFNRITALLNERLASSRHYVLLASRP